VYSAGSRNLRTLAGPGAGLASALILILVGFRYTGFPAPSEIYVIGAGFLFSLLAIVLAFRPGAWLPRIVGAALGVPCSVGWFFVLVGGYM
jgi:hypothetical protein